MDRVKKGYKISSVAVLVWGALIGIFFILFPSQISGVFFHEANVIPIFVSYLIIVGLSEPLMCLELMTSGAISGLGNTKLASAISISLTSLRIPLAYLFSHTALGLDGIWWALTLTSVVKGIVFFVAFHWDTAKKMEIQHQKM